MSLVCFTGGIADSQDLDRFLVGEQMSHFGRANDRCRSTVAFQLQAGSSQIGCHLRVKEGLHVFHDIVEIMLFCQLFIGLAGQGQRILGCGPSAVDGHMDQGIVHLIIGQAVGIFVPCADVVLMQVRAAHHGTGVSTVIDPLQGLLEHIVIEFSADVSRLVGICHSITELDAAGQNDIVFAGSNRVDCLLNSQITGTASLGMMDGSLASHAKPFGHLHIRCDIVGSVKRACLAVEIEIHVLRGNAGIFHCLVCGISEQFTFCEAFCFRIVHRVHKRGTPDTDD